MKRSNRVWRPVLAVAVLVVVATGCDCTTEEDSQEAVDQDQEVSEEVDEPDEEAVDEIFGLPAPPDHHQIREQETWVRISTEMDLDELHEFLIEEVVDAEVVATDQKLQLVPLRPHSPRAEASHRLGPDSPVVIDYRHPGDDRMQGPPIGEDSDEEVDDGDDEREVAEGDGGRQAADDRDGPPIGEVGVDAAGDDSDFELRELGQRPDWLEDVKGEPVELETRDGEPLAPGAKWGEPYVPPEGSPLHQERYRHNFGRPFGDWR